MSGLSDFQVEVTRLFFSLSSSEGFLLAGGGALLAAGLTNRPTQDLDFFGAPDDVDVVATRDDFERAVRARGWRCDRIQVTSNFARLRVSGTDEVVVDLAIDVPAGRPPFITVVGPTFDLEELAGRKLCALFGRAEARDFTDVYQLARQFDVATLMARAAEIDLGFDPYVLADMLRTIDRFSDDELPTDGVTPQELREYFRKWANDLDSTAGH